MPRADFVPRTACGSNAKPIGRKQAESIATQLIALMRRTRADYALFIGAACDYIMTPRYGARFPRWCDEWPSSLCGIYSPKSTLDEVIDDILAMDA